jgi:O-antigen/teichoic acid export membrane protein
MQSTNRFALFNQQRFIPGVMTLVALLLVKLYGNLSPLSAAVCYLAPPIPVLVYILWRMRDRIGISFVGARDAAARLLRYGARACGIDILGTVAQQADQVLVVGLLSATDMGLYAVALSISRVPSLIFTAMCDVISSKAIGLAPSALTDIVGRATRLTGFGGTLAAGALAALLPFALPLFYGTAFGAAVIITDILLLEMIAAGVASTLAIGFLATGHPGIVTLVRGGSLALVVPLLFILIPRFALVGAASALLISSVARIVAFVVLYRSTIGTPPPSLVVSPDDLRFIYRRLQADAALVSA